MGINARQNRRVRWLQTALIGAALIGLPAAACSGSSDSGVGQSADTLKGGTPADGKNKDKTNSGQHSGQAGSAAHGQGNNADGGVEDKGDHGQGQGAAGSKSGGQGQGQGRPEAGSGAQETHGKSGQAHAGSHAQGPKAGHGADEDDMNDEADETP